MGNKSRILRNNKGIFSQQQASSRNFKSEAVQRYGVQWFLYLGLCLAACQSTAGHGTSSREPLQATPAVVSPSEPMPMSPSHFIDGEKVDRDTFQHYLDSMTPVEGTWFCDDEEGGGTTGQDFRTAGGMTYAYEEQTSDEGDRVSLTRRSGP